MLIKGNVLPDEQNKMEISGLGTTKIAVYCKLTKIILLSVKLYTTKDCCGSLFLCCLVDASLLFSV